MEPTNAIYYSLVDAQQSPSISQQDNGSNIDFNMLGHSRGLRMDNIDVVDDHMQTWEHGKIFIIIHKRFCDNTWSHAFTKYNPPSYLLQD